MWIWPKKFKAGEAKVKGKGTIPHPSVKNENYIIDLPPELEHKGWQIELAINVVFF